MEAKVDIEKLQILNDRIAQTIEALNQVRLSVHAVQTGGQVGQGMWGGMSHTPFNLGQSSFGQPSFGQPSFGQPSFGQPSWPYQQYQQYQQYGQTVPWMGQPMTGGLGHTPYGYQQFGGRPVDPRIAQTFPYAQYDVLPFRQY